jgi:tRNA (guanine-N7-)-methyltransferase
MPEPALHPDVPDRLRLQVEARQARLRETLAALLAGRDGFTWEIGCGNGHWLVDYAAARPDVFAVGIDLIAFRIERAEAKKRNAHLGNVVFLKAEAWEFLKCLPDGVRPGCIVLLYPDPWPKKRHWKNRLLQEPFLQALAQRCAPGASLFFRTDHHPYFEMAAAAVDADPRWERAPETLWPHERETLFQKRTESDGRHSLVARLR